MNINTKEYWNNRFESGDWEEKEGKMQTKFFALSQTPRLKLSKDFSGTILDFGCGLGDAIPLYKEAFPNAKLMGVDISESAIKQCKETYGDIADFISGTHVDVPNVDVIISSNVFEHLSNDLEIAKHLTTKCKELYIFTPYNERVFQGHEHVNTYLPDYYKEISRNYLHEVFKVNGHSESFFSLLFNVYLKNIIRKLLGKVTVRPRLQIMYFFKF